jgi:hypothetical protein
MLQRPAAWVLERYLSSRSPPDHLLYQMLKMVPVWGGGSEVMVLGSTWGRAGRRFLRMIFLTLRSGGAATSWEVVVRAVDSSGESFSGCASEAAGAWSTSAIVVVVGLDGGGLCLSRFERDNDVLDLEFYKAEAFRRTIPVLDILPRAVTSIEMSRAIYIHRTLQHNTTTPTKGWKVTLSG